MRQPLPPADGAVNAFGGEDGPVDLSMHLPSFELTRAPVFRCSPSQTQPTDFQSVALPIYYFSLCPKQLFRFIACPVFSVERQFARGFPRANFLIGLDLVSRESAAAENPQPTD